MAHRAPFQGRGFAVESGPCSRNAMSAPTSPCFPTACEAQDYAGWTPLHFVAADGNASACRSLLAAGADVASKSPGDGFSALHLASRFGHAAAVRSLLQAGAPADAQDAYGHTALHFAAGFGHEAAAAELISFGAQADAKDARGLTPAETARSAGFEAVLRAIEAASGKGRGVQGRLLDWLRAIGLESLYTAMLEQGFDDLAFIAEAGFTEADCDAVGVRLAGHRKKLTSLYRIKEFSGELAAAAGDDGDGDDEAGEDGSDDDDDDEDESGDEGDSDEDDESEDE